MTQKTFDNPQNYALIANRIIAFLVILDLSRSTYADDDDNDDDDDDDDDSCVANRKARMFVFQLSMQEHSNRNSPTIVSYYNDERIRRFLLVMSLISSCLSRLTRRDKNADRKCRCCVCTLITRADCDINSSAGVATAVTIAAFVAGLRYL
uniref:Uncharacterized protein n=1 Tax=Vespula pensylvanica TaxID=30213 RepID=A0A834K866_VESPE|nr:hypothetical protein H0235_015284 [Vespula pensylvanica]